MDISQVIGDYKAFVSDGLRRIEQTGIVLEDFPCDHLCYRVSSVDEYRIMRQKLMPFAAAYIENHHHGRKVIKFQLRQKLLVGSYKVPLIELPAPKTEVAYPDGLEHFELVVGDKFDEFKLRYKQLWNGGDDSGPFNQTVYITFNNGTTVKFHQRPLLEVLKLEGQHFNLV